MPTPHEQTYHSAISSNIAGLSRLLVSMGVPDPDAATEIRSLAHTLRLTGKQYGFPDITDVAARTVSATEDALPAAVLTLIEVLTRHGVEVGPSLPIHIVGGAMGIAGALADCGVPCDDQDASMDLVVAEDADEARGLLSARPADHPAFVWIRTEGANLGDALDHLGATEVLQGPQALHTLAEQVAAWHQAQARRIHSSETDPLTQLPNHAGLSRQWRRLQRAGRSCSVVALDFGPGVVGTALLEAAARLRRTIRMTDVLGPWTGSTFVMLFPDTMVPHALAGLDRVTRGLGPLRTTFTAGVVPAQPGAPLEHAVADAEAQRQRAKPLDQIQAGAPLLANEHVLVVAHDPAVGQQLSELLQSADYRTEYRSDATSALKRCNERKFDLIVVDLGLPDRQPTEVLQALRADRRWAMTPVLVLASGASAATRAAMDAGADDHHTGRLADAVDKVKRLLAG